MPTKPLESIIYRELSIARAKEIIKDITPLFQELVNYGSNAIVRSATSSKSEENIDLACLDLYRHILEMTDAVEVLIANSCAYPTIPLLRSTFEALISLDFILEENHLFEQKSLCWLVVYIHDKINIYESLIPSTDRGKAFQASLSKDKSIQNFQNIDESKVIPAIQNLQNLLCKPQLQSIETEYSLYRKTYKKNPKGYSLFGGPKNIQTLAYHVNRFAQYDFLYRYWSRVTHAHDFRPFINVSNDGQSGIREIRDPSMILEVTRFSLTFMIEGTRLLLSKFRPTENFAKYYIEEIKDKYMSAIKS